LNFAGKFDATSEGPGAHSHAYVNIDSSQTHAPSDALIVPDAQLLFHADYSRAGTDLVLTAEDRHYVVHDYFKGSHRAPLASRDGAHLTPDIVKALVGEVHVAQAGNNPAPSQVIGHVTKLQGSASVIRNGVSIILNNGDNVEKGDVVQSGSNSTVGITFIDGTVFGLSSNARMVLNEMVYDPNGSSNTSLMSLVAGTITFVAGETAKHGDMKIDTPVATMGIRGTAVLVEIDFTVPGQNGQPNASFQVLVEPDGTTGSYILFDKTTLQPIAIVNQAGQQININNGIISQTTNPLSPDVQKLIGDVFQLKFTDNNNPNTKTTSIGSDTVVPTSKGVLFKTADGTTAFVPNPAGTNNNATPDSHQTSGTPLQHVPNSLVLLSQDTLGASKSLFTTSELVAKTGDVFDFESVGGKFVFTDINPGDQPTVSAAFSNVVYSGHGGTFSIGTGQTTPPAGLNALQFADITATAIDLFLAPDANNANNGSYTWIYALRDNAFDFLAAGETLTFTYHITLASNFQNGPEFAGLDVTITVTGTNDQPVITTSTQSIAYAAGKSTPGGMLTSNDPTTGTFAFTDVDLTDTHTVSTVLTSAVMSNGGTVPPLPEQLFETALTAQVGTDSNGTGNGVINWQFGKDANGHDDLPVYLADFIPFGETLTLTYTVTVTDSQGATSQQTVTVTITGTDQAAVVWIDTTPGGGSWNDAANWGTGTVPTATDDAIVITNQLIGLTPSYPVTVDHAAAARSLSMNDFGNTPPILINYSTLAIGAGGINAAADSVINNQGTLTVAGKAEFVDQAVLNNSGTLKLSGGGDFKDSASITNSGTLEVVLGTLNVVVDIANSVSDGEVTHSGTIKVDSGATLAFSGTVPAPHKIDGGTVNILGTLDLEGSVSLQNGALTNSGLVDVTGGGNALDNENVTNSGQITLETGAFLTLDLGTDVTGAGTITVKNTATLTVTGATVDGNTVTNQSGGTVALTGAAVLKNSSLGNAGQVNVSGTGNKLDHETVTNSGAIELLSGDLTIDLGSNVTGAGTVTVDSGATLTVNGATIDGNGITNKSGGTVALTGSAALKNKTLDNSGQVNVSSTGNALDHETVTNSGAIEVLSGALLLDLGTNVSGAGTVTVDGGATLTVNGATIDGNAITNKSNGTIALTGSAALKNAALGNAGQINVSSTGNSLDNETVTNSGAIEVLSGALLLDLGTDVTGAGTVQVDSGATLTVNGATIDGNGITNKSGGTIALTGSAALKNGALGNSGQINVTSTGNSLDNETVTNSGAIEVISGDLTLDLGTDVTGAGTVQVDSGATLTVNGATIDGNGITNKSGGAIALTGSAALKNAALGNAGQINISGTGNALDHEIVTNTGTIEVLANAALTIDQVSSVDNTNGQVKVDGTATLTLNNASINYGTVTNSGTIRSSGGGAINNADITNTGLIESTVGIMTIDPVGTHTLTNSGTVQANGGEIDVIHELVTNNSALQSVNHGTLKLSSTVVTNGSGTVTVDGTSELDLASADITGGNLNNSGKLESVSGTNTVSAAVNNTGGTIEVQAGTLDLAGGITGTGTVIIDAGATLELGGADAQTVTFKGGAGTTTLTLDATTHAFTGTITGNATTSGTNLVNGQASITTASGDAIDFNASGGNGANPDQVTLTLGGTITGAANGIHVIQSGTGDIAVNTSGAVTGLAGDGIIAEDTATGSGKITVNATGKVTGTGANSVGIFVNNANAANGSAISVTATGGAVGDQFGIYVDNSGNGNVTLEAGGTVTATGATGQYGIRAIARGTGSETVTTDANLNLTSAGTGINVANFAQSIDAAANSAINVTTYGTIHSGTTANIDGSVAGGIYAGYRGIAPPTQPSAAPGVHGTVVVTNYATITADAGYGIDAYNWGVGDVTVNEKGGSITAAQTGLGAYQQGGVTGDVTVNVDGGIAITGTTGFGIQAFSTSSGKIAVNMTDGDSVTSGNSGIAATNAALAIDANAHSTITVNAHGTINSGAAGTAGILAGYSGNGANNPPAVNPAVNGTVTVNNYANVTAAAGYGIDAFNYGNGDVTVNDENGTTVSGVTAGIGAFQNNSGTGDVAVNLYGNANVTSVSGFGITARTAGSGDITINTSANSTVLSGDAGIRAAAVGSGDIFITSAGHVTSTGASGIFVNQNGANATGSTTIANSGTVLGSTTAAAIVVHGNTTGTATIDNSGTIGPATISATTSAISEDGASLTLDNASGGVINGHINAAHTTFHNEAGATWNTGGASSFGAASTIDNAGAINLSYDASIGGPGLAITNEGTIDNVSGAGSITAAITNSGTIEVTGGSLTLNTLTLTNFVTDVHGVTTDGHVSTASGTTLTLAGSSILGGIVTNEGMIDTTGLSAINAAITNDGHIEVMSGTLTLSGSLSGLGSLTIDANATLELNLDPTQTITFGAGGSSTLILDGTVSHQVHISGFDVGDSIDLKAIGYDTPTTATYSYDATSGVLTVTDANGDHIDLNIGTGYAGAHFAGSSDGHGGTLVTMEAPDAAPFIAAAGKSTDVSVAEQGNSTGADPSVTDPSPAASGTIVFTDVDLTDRPTPTVTYVLKWTDAHGNDLTGTLSAGQIAAVEQALHVTQPDTTHNNSAVDWTYSIADASLDFLAANETLQVNATITINDGQGGHDAAQVNVTISGADDAPKITTATSDAFSEAAGTGNTGTNDHAGGTISFTDVDLSDRPVVTAPFHDYTYKAADGTTDLTLTDPQKAALEAALTITAAGNNANNGSATWSYDVADSKFDFLAAGETLTLTYTATVTDSQGVTATQPITVTIHGTNDAPHINGVSATAVPTNEDSQVTISGLSVSDPDAESSIEQITLSVDHGSIDFDGQHGSSLTITGTLAEINTALHDGVVYTPASNYSGIDTLHLSVNDQVPNAALSDSASVGIAVSPVADAPPVPSAFAGNAGGTITLAGLTALTDTDGSESLSLNLSGFPAGSVFNAGHLDANTGHWVISVADITGLHGAALTVTPPANYGGNFSLHVDATVTDTATLQSGPVTDTKTFSNDIAVAVDKLTATDDSITTEATFTQNTQTTFATSVLLANDADSLGKTITVTAVGDANHHSANGGTVTLNGNVIDYTPASNFSGQDSFTYTISDGGQTKTATVTFNVVSTGPTFVVTSAADDSSGHTLRDAIVYANAHPGTIITFAGSIANSTITLTKELPLITGDGTVVDGGSNHITVSGNDHFRGFFVGDTTHTITATIENITIAHASAHGGAGGAGGGGGGAGLGGAIFVSSHSTLNLINASLQNDSAVGGAGGSKGSPTDFGSAGGGGGMGGAGGAGNANGNDGGGGGGGFGVGADGGVGLKFGGGSGDAGDFAGGASGGHGTGARGTSGGAGGADGGGGGGGGFAGAGGGGGVGGDAGQDGPNQGGDGGFGGGGGGGGPNSDAHGGDGGFGGGGGGGGDAGYNASPAGDGGFGGGGGGYGITAGHGGFGGGDAVQTTSPSTNGGGGGAGMGGGIFVMDGGVLNISGSLSVSNGTVTGGHGADGSHDGSAFGSGIFYEGANGTLTFAPGAGQTETISGDIADMSGSGGTGNNAGVYALTLNGAGTLVLAGTDTYTGATTLVNGTLQVDGSIAHSAVTVQSGATLDGDGTIGAVTVQSGGTVGAGDGAAGLLSTGNFTLASGSLFTEEIGGATAGSGYDQIKVAGTVTLNGAMLSLSELNGFRPTSGGTFEIIDNDGVDAVSGTFAGLAEGASVQLGGQNYTISYHGGDGNDVTLTTGPQTVNITVSASDGVDFNDDPNPITEMGSGVLRPGATATTYTVFDHGSGNDFVFDGFGFTYNSDGHVTGGTITAIHEYAANGSPIVDFTGQFDAVQWMAGVKQAAQGDFSAINALVAAYNFDFEGGAGPDSFGGAGHSQILSGHGGNDVLDPDVANGGVHTLTGGSGADTFVYRVGYGAVTITDFDRGNSGSFDPTEGDQIRLDGFSQPPTITSDGNGNTIADFGNGDVLTFLNVTPTQVQSISAVVQPPTNGVAYSNPPGGTLALNSASSQSFKIAGAAISSSNGPGVNLQVTDAVASDRVLLDIDAASTISTVGPSGVAGINIGSAGASVDLVNNASVSTYNANGAVGINVGIGSQGAGNITLVNTGNVFAGSTGIAANNNSSSVPQSANSFIFVSNFGNITAGANPQSTNNNIPANGIWAGYGNGSAPTTWGTVVVDNNADVTATSSLQGGASGIVAFNNSNGNITVNEGQDTNITGFKYGIQAVANNRGIVNGVVTAGAGSASGDVTINLSQNVHIQATSTANGTYGIFAENFNNLEGNITVNMAAGDTITSGGAGINVYDGAASLPSGTILVNAEGTIHSGSALNGTGGQPAGILAGYLGTANGITPSSFPIVGLNGNVIINSKADITAAVGDGIRGYTYGATGDVTINATGGTIIAQALAGTTNGNGDGISAQNNGGGNIHVTTAADISITAGGSGVAANNGDNGNAAAVNGEISLVIFGTIESGTNAGILSGSGNLTAGILAGYNATSSTAATPNVHGNVVIDDHATITADVGDGIRGYNFGTGDVTITVEDEASVHGARYGVAAFTYGGGHISLTNHGSVTGTTDAIDVNVGGNIPNSGTATFENDGHINGNIGAYNTDFTNDAGGDWSLNGTSTFSGVSTLSNAGTIESNGTSAVSGLAALTNTGTIEVQSGSLILNEAISGAGTLKIDAGATLELASGVSSDQTVSFASSTGVLKIDDPQDFHGKIAGISGSGNVLDLLNHFNAATTTATTGAGSYNAGTDTTTLTVTDSSTNSTETFRLAGDLSHSLWTVADDNHGGVTVVDPPAPASTNIVASSANQTLTGTAGADNFVFTANFGKDTITNYAPGTDSITLDHTAFSGNVNALLAAAQDDGNGNTVITVDANDTITLQHVLKQQLAAHTSDFHFI
jgi:VCBS repeat-containing protein